MTDRTIRFRDYRAGDAPTMATIYFDAVRQLGPRRYSAEQVAAWAPELPSTAALERRAEDGRTTIVAEDARGRLLGFADLEPDGHIDLFYCRPEMAGTGLAADLLDALLARAAAQGIAALHVEASELARSLFERRGFILDHRRDFEIGGVAIHNYRLVRRSVTT